MKIPTLRFYPERAPRKKLRGKGRYFRRIVKQAVDFQLELGPDAWFDHWHYHADWDGWGNLGWSYRLPHVRALCAVLRNVAAAQARFATPFQTWIVLNGEDAGQDATYVHTPNPNGAPFPMLPSDMTVGSSPLVPIFSSLLPELKLRFGWHHSAYDDDGVTRWATSHWIWAEGVGCELWPG